MKICYIGVYRDGTGYSAQAVNNILALEAGGIDVVARAVKFSPSQNNELAKRVEHLENKTTDGVDVVIQHVLPHQFEYKAGVKNVGIFCWETSHFNKSNWGHCCNLMDELWVPSTQNVQAIKNSKVTTPTKILPCACDIQRFNSPPEPLNIPRLKNKCVFYTIGEMSRRKNVVAILRAFYGAFSLRDDVVLVIKTNVPGKTPEEARSVVQSTIDDIKKSIHIYARHPYYPPVVCITDFLPDEQLDRLHMACDVFVSASHGEAWGIPAHDAMGFGNPVILSNWGSYPELVDSTYVDRYWFSRDNIFSSDGSGTTEAGWLIDGQLTPCFGHTDSFPDLYTGEESWFEPNVCHFIECMKSAYKMWQDKELGIMGEAAKQRAAEFSYDKVGVIARELLGVS
ncbi:hypothetical protein LCGC14_0141770 [marine sediment metagenome]|uniref:Glycosyl transferase family 1 domain-containing protein n=1 Tax=marine sediment metagenome TaxID=412755 RepID=A0A0F9VGH6_9ZZZZ